MKLSEFKPSSSQTVLILIIFILSLFASMHLYRNGFDATAIKTHLLYLAKIEPTDAKVSQLSCDHPNVKSYTIDKSYPCLLCQGRNVTDGKWFDFSTKSFQFYAYTAFYDDRPSLLSNPVIRIIAVSIKLNDIKKIICVLHHSKGITNVSMEEQPKGCGPGVGGQPNIFTCPVPLGMKPLSLSIKGDLEVQSCMPVEYPSRAQTPHDFAVCVPVSFGRIDPIRLIEWVEMLRILGVGLIGVYDLALHEDSCRILRHYANEGFVDFRKTDALFSGGRHNVLQSATVVNECYYRHMYDAKYVIVIDLDEFIRPLLHENLIDLVKFLEKNITDENSTASPNYIIRNSYFLLEQTPDTNISSHLAFLRYRMRSPVSVNLHRMKPIINSMSCTHMFNHHCLGATGNYSNRKLDESIDPAIAHSQHYRHCPPGYDCKKAMKESRLDDTMLKYTDVLKTNVRRQILEILKSVPANWF